MKSDITRRGVGQSIYFPIDLYEEMVEAAKEYPSLAQFVQQAVAEKIKSKEASGE